MPQDDGQETQPPGQPASGDARGIARAHHARRYRQRRERRTAWPVLALVLAGHVLVAWLAWLVLKPTLQHRTEAGAISVMVFESPSTLPAPPSLVHPPPPLPGQPPPPPPVHYEPPAKGAIQAELEGVKGPPLDLYGSNGQIRIPSAASTGPAPAYTAPPPKGSDALTIKNPVKYKPTRFNKAWRPADQTLGGKLLDEAIDKTTVEKTVRLPGGIKLHCVLSPLALVAGCPTAPPPPPPSNDDDIRLSLPPAETLTGKKVEVPSSASSTPAPAATAPANASSQAPPAAAASTL